MLLSEEDIPDNFGDANLPIPTLAREPSKSRMVLLDIMTALQRGRNPPDYLALPTMSARQSNRSSFYLESLYRSVA